MPKTASKPPIASKLKVWPTNHEVEFAPGQTVVPHPPSSPQFVAIAQMVHCGGENYRLVAKRYNDWHAVNAELLRACGVNPGQRTIHRLVEAGFIKGRRLSPHTLEISIASLFEHLERAENPEFWTYENLRRYRAAIV